MCVYIYLQSKKLNCHSFRRSASQKIKNYGCCACDCVFKTYLQYKVRGIYKAKMTYEHLKYLHDLAFGKQSCLQRVRKLIYFHH